MVRQKAFPEEVKRMRREGMTLQEIADAIGCSLGRLKTLMGLWGLSKGIPVSMKHHPKPDNLDLWRKAMVFE